MAFHRTWATRLLWITGLLALSVLMASCAPVFSRYRYISLENYKDVRIVDSGRPDPGERTYFVGRVPIRYGIPRPEYTIILELDVDAMVPTVDILVQPIGERVVEFVGKYGVDVPECVYRYDPHTWEPFRWSYAVGDCEGGYDKLDKVIRFNVRDLDGNLLGEEAIPYEIKRDGFFYYIDAI